MIPLNRELDLNIALEVAVEAAKSAGEIITSYRKESMYVHRKERNDIVSSVDLLAEKEIFSILQTQFPTHYFFSEESSKGNFDSDWRWVIDPLDGTINYVAGIPLYSVSIALQNQGQTVLGVVYNPVTTEIYTSIKGQGSFLGVKRLKTSDNRKLSDSILSFMLTSHYDENQVNIVLDMVRKLAIKCRGLRLYVSQALELAYIANSRLDGTICIKSKGFSPAAGVLILREAGGKATDLLNREFSNKSENLLATNSFVHERILRILQKGSVKR